jgi:hypothetical protein
MNNVRLTQRREFGLVMCERRASLKDPAGARSIPGELHPICHLHVYNLTMALLSGFLGDDPIDAHHVGFQYLRSSVFASTVQKFKPNCSEGNDTLFLLDREGCGPYNSHQARIATLASRFTGIRIDVYTHKDAFQLCSCNGQNGGSCNHCAAVLQQMANHRYS